MPLSWLCPYIRRISSFLLPVRLFVAIIRIITDAVELERVFFNGKVVNLFKHILDLLNPGVTEFDHFTAFVANDMIMLPVGVGTLIDGLILPELMTLYKSAFQ